MSPHEKLLETIALAHRKIAQAGGIEWEGITPLEKLILHVRIGIKEGVEAAAKLTPEEALRSSQRNIQDLRQRGILPPAKKRGKGQAQDASRPFVSMRCQEQASEWPCDK